MNGICLLTNLVHTVYINCIYPIVDLVCPIVDLVYIIYMYFLSLTYGIYNLY